MNITGYIWRGDVIDKPAWKHQVDVEEVVEVFENRPRIERLEKRYRPGEDLSLWVKAIMVDICSLPYTRHLFAENRSGEHPE